MKSLSTVFFGGLFFIHFWGSGIGVEAAPLGCVASVPSPAAIRHEGYADYVSDFLVTCTGGDPLFPFTADFQIFLNVNLTSNLVDQNPSPTTEALLLVNEPSPGTQVLNSNVFRGIKAGVNSIVWVGIPIVPPGDTGTLIIRLTNIRVNAHSVSTPPAPIIGYLSVPFLPLSNQQQTMANVLSGLTFSIIDASPTKKNLIFRENFPGAFKKKIEVDSLWDPIMQNIPGTNYGTESGFTTVFSPSDLTGKADTGTRMVARFQNIPVGASLSAPLYVFSDSSLMYGQLMTQLKADYSGGIPATSEVIPICNNSAYVVWEVMGMASVTGDSVIDQFTFPLTISGASGFGTMAVQGGLGPINVNDSADLIAPEPRFHDYGDGFFPFTVCNYLPLISR